MEDILEVYKRPFDPRRPLVCFDESSKQHVKEVINPMPIEPGKPERYDTEYERNGVSNLFMMFEPLTGWRHVEVTDRRQLEYASPASLYKAFSPEEARRIIDKLEFHYTPKHGSWLDMAEIELSILSRQCLDRRIPTQDILRREVKAWEEKRNESKVTTQWRFTTEDARIKLKRLYPRLPELDNTV